MSVGPDHLFAKFILAQISAEQEESTLHGEFCEHWLNPSEPDEFGFLLPYAFSSAPHARTQDSVFR